MRKTSKAREEVKDVVGRENSSQKRAPSLFGSFTASSQAGRIAHHILAAGKTQTVSTLGEKKKKHKKHSNTLQPLARTGGSVTRIARRACIAAGWGGGLHGRTEAR